MGLFGRSREERFAAAAEALRPYGFVLDVAYAQGLTHYEPLALMSSPSFYSAGALGSIEGARVEAYEYGSVTRDADGNVVYHSALAVAVHHPWVNGGAAFSPDDKEWGGAAAVLDTLLW